MIICTGVQVAGLYGGELGFFFCEGGPGYGGGSSYINVGQLVRGCL